MNRKISTENLKNLNDGETIETPRGTFRIERFCYQINLYENGGLASCDYLSEYLGNDGFDKAWDYDVKIEYVKEDGSTGFGYTYWDEYTWESTDSDGSTYLEESAEFSLEDEDGRHIDTYDIDRWRVVYDEGDEDD